MKWSLLAVFLFAGCGGTRSLDGEWTLSGLGSGEQPPGATTKMIFSGSKAVTVAMTIQDDRLGRFSLDMKGTYKVDGADYTMSMTDAKVDTSRAKPEFKSAIERLVNPEELKKRINQETKYQVKWVSDREVHLVGAAKSYVLKR